MTAKEKAIELVGRYHLLNINQGVFLDAKQCALIAVDEILNALPCKVNFHLYELTGEVCDTDIVRYFKEVKQHINGL